MIPEGDPEDLEWRLHTMLDARAGQVDGRLSGPVLRLRAQRSPRSLRRTAPALAAAATVAAVAVGTAAFTGGGGPHRQAPIQPGGASVTRSTARSSSTAPDGPPTPSPSPTSAPARPAAPSRRAIPGPSTSSLPNVVVVPPGLSTMPAGPPAAPSSTAPGRARTPITTSPSRTTSSVYITLRIS